MQKIEQLVRLVRESHEQPMTGESRVPEMVSEGETGVTFLGHSSFLLQMGGKNILVDPVFSTRLIVLRRQRRPGVQIRDLPPIDLVLVTHAHMDHLDKASLRRVVRATRRLQRERSPEIVVPHGVEDLVDEMGFNRVHALSWWQEIELHGFRIVMTPCKHWGARMFRDTHREYGGYFIAPPGGGATVYHSGDTAYFDGFAEVGRGSLRILLCCPLALTFQIHTAVFTRRRKRRCGDLSSAARSGWCRCTLAPSGWGVNPWKSRSSG